MLLNTCGAESVFFRSNLHKKTTNSNKTENAQLTLHFLSCYSLTSRRKQNNVSESLEAVLMVNPK
jgi:hypothetical protein